MSSLPNKPLLIAIVGPTAIGKTSLSIALAKHFDTVVISADSRQMYRDIPIGTACPTLKEQAGVPHYFLAHLALEETCSAGQFEREALGLISGELRDKHVIILCGGSGLYVKALLEGLDDVPKDDAVRAALNVRYKEKGLDNLLSELQTLDPLCASQIDSQNPQRVIRALEVCLSSGKPFSSYLRAEPKTRPFKSLTIGLRAERALLAERIASRSNEMLSNGWLEEAARVKDKRHLNSLNTIGYKSIFAYLDGSIDMDTCKEQIVRETSQFAKRQMTWFKKMNGINWVDIPSENMLQTILELT
jgi:tRNA dimethylallyltransferase